MSQATDEEYATNLGFYEKLISTHPKVERKGATMPYTSLNGHMFSFLTKEGKMALRLPAEERQLSLEKFDTQLCVQYGAVMKEYVVVPEALLRNSADFKKYFDISFAYASSLKPKPTKRKTGAKKKTPRRKKP